jgi:Icc-related predicted phosphoesterase
LNSGILVTHSPPYGFLDKLDGLPNIGSKEIRKGIQKTAPKLVLCGHFHELFGIEKLDDTIIFNPGAIKDSRYGVIYLKGDKIKTEIVNV